MESNSVFKENDCSYWFSSNFLNKLFSLDVLPLHSFIFPYLLHPIQDHWQLEWSPAAPRLAAGQTLDRSTAHHSASPSFPFFLDDLSKIFRKMAHFVKEIGTAILELHTRPIVQTDGNIYLMCEKKKSRTPL